MFSNFIRFTLTLTALSPVLLSLWGVMLIQNWNQLSFEIHVSTFQDIWSGMLSILQNHYLLILFIGIVVYARFFMKKAVKKLSVIPIDLKSIKPADPNFITILFSIFLPFSKLTFSAFSDSLFIAAFIVLAIVYGFVVTGAYHYNLILRIFLGYKHYEVQSKKEVTFIALSQKALINPNQLTQCVKFAEYMIVNVTGSKKT